MLFMTQNPGNEPLPLNQDISTTTLNLILRYFSGGFFSFSPSSIEITAMSESIPSRLRFRRSAQACDVDIDDHPQHTDPTHQKVSQVAQLLQEWGWSFAELVRGWINHNNKPGGRRSASKRVDILHALLADGSDVTFKAIKDDPIFLGVVDMTTEYLVQGMRAEFVELQQRSIFGQ